MFSVTSLVQAADGEEKAKPIAASGVDGGQALQVFLALIFVIAVIGIVAWGMRRFSGLTPVQNPHLKIQAVLPVGTRERIALVQVGNRQILVGITSQQITTLHTLDEPLELSGSGGDFARKLQSLLHRSENEAKGAKDGAN